MGLTLIRKSSGRPPKRNPRIALVLSGGAVSGGAFKVGGLKALNDFFVGRGVCGNFSITALVPSPDIIIARVCWQARPV